jgi:DNA-binding CsgD family transcriptional regulator
LVGRAGELVVLHHALLNPPALVIVEGGYGVGKTRLIEEVVDQAADIGIQTIVGHCYPLLEPYPLAPVIEAIRAGLPTLSNDVLEVPIVGALRPFLPEVADRLPAVPEALGGPDAERHQVLRAIHHVVNGMGRTLFVLDDLHWCDSFTLEFLTLLVAQLPEQVSLVLAYRREDVPEGSPLLGLVARPPSGTFHARLSLQPLNREGSREMIAAILETNTMSEGFVDYVHERTSGLPFAIEEVLKLLQDRKDLVKLDGYWLRRALDEVRVPLAIRDAVIERLSSMSSDAQAVARVAAVVGRECSPDLLEDIAALDRERFLGALSELLVRSLLIESQDGIVGFRHLIARDAIYEALPGPRRKHLHRRVAVALDDAALGSPAELAHHYRLSGQSRKWVENAEKASDIAASMHDSRGAFNFLVQTLDAQDLDEDTYGRLAIKIGESAMHALAHDEATELLRDVVDNKPLPRGTRVQLQFFLGGLLYQGGNLVEGRRRDLAILDDLWDLPDLKARVLSSLGIPDKLQTNLSEDLEFMQQALKMLDTVSDPAARIAVQMDHIYLKAYTGSPDALGMARALEPEDLSGGELRELARGYANLASAALFLCDFSAAEEFRQRTASVCASIRYWRFSDDLEIVDAYARWVRGEWEGLSDRLLPLIAATRHCPQVWGKAVLPLASLTWMRGDVQAARELLDEILQHKEGMFPPVLVQAHAQLASLEASAGDLERATELLNAGLELLRHKGIWVWAGDLAIEMTDLLVGLERLEEAESLVAEIDRHVADRYSPGIFAALLYCRGRLALARKSTDGQSLIREATAAWRAIGRPLEIARCLEALAEADDNGAVKAYSDAMHIYGELGATREVARLRRKMRRAGIKVSAPSRRGRTGYGKALSPRELAVARLAATGRTNREIAESMFLSPKTIDHHLQSAMRKLDVHSRKALGGRSELLEGSDTG